MKQINKILVPTDFSDTANNSFHYALWFAEKYGASIQLLHIVYPEAEPLDFPVMVAQATQNRVDAAKVALKALTDTTLAQVTAAHQLEQLPAVFSNIMIGVPRTLIADIAEREQVDLIILGTKAKHNLVERTFGSVTTATINKANCPVLVIPENIVKENISTVAYATDLKEADPWHIWSVCQLLKPFNFILRIVHIEQGSEEKRPFELKVLEEFFQEHSPSLQITFHNIASQDIKDELKDFSDIFNVDLLVLHKPKRELFDRIFHKSISRRIALDSNTALLIIQ